MDAHPELEKFYDFVRHVKLKMEELCWVQNWLKQFFWCAGIDLKDAFLHIALHESIRKFFRFKWKGKLYEWQVLPFGLKCSPRILTKMVKSILVFLHSKGISLSGFIDDFINQAACRGKTIFKINVIALVFM